MGVRWEKSESRTCYAQATWRLWLTLIIGPSAVYTPEVSVSLSAIKVNSVLSPRSLDFVLLINRQLTDIYSHELYKNQGIVVRFPEIERVITRVAFIGDRKLSVQIERVSKNADNGATIFFRPGQPEENRYGNWPFGESWNDRIVGARNSAACLRYFRLRVCASTPSASRFSGSASC